MNDEEFERLKKEESAQKLKARGKNSSYRNYKREYQRAKERMEARENGDDAERTRLREAQRKRRRSESVREREREYARKRRMENPELAKKAKEQLKQWRDLRLAEAREIARQWRCQGCSVCGEFNPCCIDAHHKNPDEKSASIGQIVNMGLKPEVVHDELEKCIPICANCHRKYHDGSDVAVFVAVQHVLLSGRVFSVRGVKE